MYKLKKKMLYTFKKHAGASRTPQRDATQTTRPKQELFYI